MVMVMRNEAIGVSNYILVHRPFLTFKRNRLFNYKTVWADILRYTFLKYTGELSTKVYSSLEVNTKVYLTSILRYTLN